MTEKGNISGQDASEVPVEQSGQLPPLLPLDDLGLVVELLSLELHGSQVASTLRVLSS